VSDLAVASVLAITILIAGMVSVEVALSVALLELAGGVIIGNVLTVTVPDWLAFVGSFVAGALGYANTNGGFPWILLIIQVVIAAIGVAIVSGAYGRRRRGMLRR